MKKYHKIQSLFLREPKTKYRYLLEGFYAKPEFEYLKDVTWEFTEKVDGTNIIICWTGEQVLIRGRNTFSQIPDKLFEKLEQKFPVEIFEKHYLSPLCLRGEGYGAKIQKGGGDYISNGMNFILFDVDIDEIWLERKNVNDIAKKLNIKTVPVIGEGTLAEGIKLVKGGFPSELRCTPPEGLVMRPKVELRGRGGERIITKLKLKDFK